MFSLRLRRSVALLGTLCLVASCGSDTDDSPNLATPEQEFGILQLEPNDVESGAALSVTYIAPSAEVGRASIGAGLTLRRNGEELNTLVVRDVLSENSATEPVLPPGAPIPKMQLPGRGPFRFELPNLDAGRYEVCAAVAFEPEAARSGEACADINVL
jgi:hypothetical protein